MISKNTIDKVFEQSRVEEVVGDFVQLKKSGSNFKGLSPFTNEKTPSFVVSPVKQIWKDFSSGKGGNVVAFLMEHEQLSYPEAIKYLAKKYNIEIEETQLSEKQNLECPCCSYCIDIGSCRLMSWELGILGIGNLRIYKHVKT